MPGHPARLSSSTQRAIVSAGLYLTLLLVISVYWPGLNGGLVLDDYENLRPLSDLDRGVLSWQDAIFTSDSSLLARPLAMLSFVGNMLFSGPQVWAFKFTNLMIHLVCGVLIFWLSARLLSVLRPTYTPMQTMALGLCVAALWMLAPLLVSTTLYIVQRMTQLSALFTLCGLISYVIGRQKTDSRPLWGWTLILSSLLFWMPLAILSKENGALMPLLLFVVEAFIFRFTGSVNTRRSLYILFSLALLLPALIVLATLVFNPNFFFASYVGRSFTLMERILTEPRALFFYISNLVIPQGPGLGLFHDDFVVSKSLFSPWTTLPAIVGWIFLLVLSFTARRQNWWPLFFGICFFLAAHALESSIFPLELVFEHRNYLPAFGVFFSLIFGLALLMEKLRSRRALPILIALLPITYGFATYQRADTWSSWDKILLSAEATHPNSPRVHVELASLYGLMHDLERTLAHLERVEALRKSAASAVSLHRIIAYCTTGTAIPATIYQNIPEKMATDDAGIYTINTLRELNRLLHRGTCPQLDVLRLVNRLKLWIKNAPANNYEGRLWDVYYEMAHLLQYKGRTDEAIHHLRQAQKLAPMRPEPLLVIMRYQVEKNDLPAARRTLLEINERFSDPTREQARLIAQYNYIMILLNGEKRS